MPPIAAGGHDPDNNLLRLNSGEEEIIPLTEKVHLL